MNAGSLVPLEEILQERRDHDVEVWALVATIDELEAELAEARAPGPIQGGPPPDWDRWIMDLPDDVFADCLGSPSDLGASPLQTPTAGSVPVASSAGWKTAPPAKGWQ